jgi:hypothetical protein
VQRIGRGREGTATVYGVDDFDRIEGQLEHVKRLMFDIFDDSW